VHVEHEIPEQTTWQPATSRPGELFTIEGRIAAAGAFARGLRNQDPRLSSYRRSMLRIAGGFVVAAAEIAALAVILT
jgi:hypothetical protein